MRTTEREMRRVSERAPRTQIRERACSRISLFMENHLCVVVVVVVVYNVSMCADVQKKKNSGEYKLCKIKYSKACIII